MTATAAITTINQETIEAGRPVSHDTITVWDEAGEVADTIFVESSEETEPYDAAIREAGWIITGTTADRQHAHGGDGWALTRPVSATATCALCGAERDIASLAIEMVDGGMVYVCGGWSEALGIDTITDCETRRGI